MRALPINEAKTNLSAIVEEVAATHQPVTITRHGRPVATLIATEDLETLTETLAWLADPEHAAEMAEAREAVETGKALSLDEVRAQLASGR
ncbi:MAG: type II toxin-antitoxin system Phd/YefM family antitoxin [Micrococcales bacterium]|nr:type II toxin-antitoxin system Phd/YefM family antitoxin [Micrococcales bacterium]